MRGFHQGQRFFNTSSQGRIWRTVKYEHLYTKEFNNLKEARKSLNIWFKWYNQERFHQSLDNLTPDEVYYQNQAIPQAA